MEEIFNSTDKEVANKLTKDERKEFLTLVQKLQRELEKDLDKKERK